jgi:hypothetical protein
MNVTGFTVKQNQALLDLLIVGIYVDGTLQSVEEDCIQSYLATLDFSSDYARQQFLDASYARVRKHTTSSESARAYITVLAKSFPEHKQRKLAYDALDDLLLIDNRASSSEITLLQTVKEIFQLE